MLPSVVIGRAKKSVKSRAVRRPPDKDIDIYFFFAKIYVDNADKDTPKTQYKRDVQIKVIDYHYRLSFSFAASAFTEVCGVPTGIEQ